VPVPGVGDRRPDEDEDADAADQQVARRVEREVDEEPPVRATPRYSATQRV